jgi:hypothetical protein
MISNGTDIFFGYQYYSGGYAYRLYKTDGMSLSIVKDSLRFQTPALLGNKVIFKGEKTGSSTGGEPWVTDGTTSGTMKLNPVLWTIAGTNRNISPAFNNKIYFAAQNALWETDGTIAGTVPTATATGNIWDFAVLNSVLYFNGQNSANSNRTELFKLGGVSGIGENAYYHSPLSVYPQPSAGNITIEFTSAVDRIEVTVSDLLGKKVQSLSQEVNGTSTSLDISELPEGIYLMQVRSSSGQQATKKIIVGK